MSMLNITPYNWSAKDVKSQFNIHVWGWNINSEPVLLRITEYYPTIYLQLPSDNTDINAMIAELNDITGLVKVKPTHKYKLYYYSETKTAFLKLYFDSLTAMHNFNNILKKGGYIFNGIPIIVREIEVSPIRKLLTLMKIKYSDTFKVLATPVLEAQKISTLQREYFVDFHTLEPTGEIFNIVPKVLSFRLRLNESLGLEAINVILSGNTTQTYDLDSKNGELALFSQFFNLIKSTDPDLIVGFEIFTKAYKFFGKRLKELGGQFGPLGRLKSEESTIVTNRWKSSAFGYNESHILATEGRLSIDLYNFIKRTTKLDKYDFQSVATHFGVPLDMSSLNSANKAIIQLFSQLDVWIELSELSSIVGVGIEDLFSRGEQIRSFSLIYDTASTLGYVIDYVPQPEIDVEGGYQFATEPGVYDNTLWFDFASEYPSILIAYNIDYTTLIKDDTKVPETQTNVILGTNKGAVFGTKFVKAEVRKGVLPYLIEQLIAERNNTKTLIAQTGNIRYIKRERILKTSTNAIVGFLGIPEDQGMLSLIEAFLSITFIGRDLTKTANEWLEENYSAKILYNDTDSLAIKLPEELKIGDLYSLGNKIASQITELFPNPITLKFDGVYKFVLLTAKKYAILKVNSDGNFAPESIKKGVLSIRSDTNAFSAEIYIKILDNILYGKPAIQSINTILDAVIRLQEEKVPIEDLAQVKKINTESAPTSTYFLKKFLDRMNVLGYDIPKGTEVSYLVLAGPEKAIGDRMMLLFLVKGTDHYDVNYYADSLINPLDQLLQIGYGQSLNPLITYKPPRSRKRAVGLNEPVKIINLQLSAGGNNLNLY
jgi:DNA polymerase elongation subunit (family B)